MSVEDLAERIERGQKEGRLLKVVIPVHFAGQPCDMATINALSQRSGFRSIEDASHAVGASSDQNKVGSHTCSDIAVFSFHPIKIITSGEGGTALTNDDEFADQI
jgi:dTDP-4-amino-4,6-dideoxygalactose transaminase